MELEFSVVQFGTGYALGLFTFFLSWGVSRIFLMFKYLVYPFK